MSERPGTGLDPRRVARAERRYRWLLRLFPRAFRDAHAHPMTEMFRDAYRVATGRAGYSTVRFWGRTVRDVLASAVAVYFTRGGHAPLPSSSRGLMASIMSDLRFAVRSLRKNPSFTVVAVLTIGLGIGANTVIFSVVNSILLTPLPYPAPERLVVVFTQFPEQGQSRFDVSAAEYLDFGASTRAFESIGAFSMGSATLTGDGEAERITVGFSTASFFDVFGATSAVGRLYDTEDDQPGGPPIALISHEFWSRRYGADPTVIGRSLTLNGTDRTIIGVVRPGFSGAIGRAAPAGFVSDVWVPLRLDRGAITDRSGHFLEVVGRLAPGTALRAAMAELDAILAGWEVTYAGQHTPERSGNHTMTLVPLDEQLLGNIRPALAILLGAVGAVLLLACANVANLLLARGAARAKEIAVRAALGAGRRRLMRQLITESLVIAGFGGLAGLILSYAGLPLLLQLDPGNLPPWAEITVDGRVIVFTLALATVTGVIFGVIPAWRGTQMDLARAVGEGGRGGSSGRETRRALNGLVVCQTGLAVALLIGSGLLTKSFLNLQRVDPGFVPDQRLVFDIALPGNVYQTSSDVVGYFDRALEAVRAQPQVLAATVVRNLPLRTTSRMEGVDIEARPELEYGYTIDYQSVTPGYFRELGIPVVTGRPFGEGDRNGARRVAVINETMQRRYWPEGGAIGDQLVPRWEPQATEPLTIVGVVGDVLHNGLSAEPRPELYLPLAQIHPNNAGWIRSATVVMRVAPGAAVDGIMTGVRAALRTVDPNVPPTNVSALSDVVTGTMAQERFMALALGAFAVIALVIAAVGVYGVTAFTVARRAREIGVRMALGARPADVRRGVLRRGFALAAVGGLAGVVIAAGLGHLLESMLYGVGARDVMVFAIGVAALLVAAGMASLVPAWRASAVDPTVSFRLD